MLLHARLTDAMHHLGVLLQLLHSWNPRWRWRCWVPHLIGTRLCRHRDAGSRVEVLAGSGRDAVRDAVLLLPDLQCMQLRLQLGLA